MAFMNDHDADRHEPSVDTDMDTGTEPSPGVEELQRRLDAADPAEAPQIAERLAADLTERLDVDEGPT